MATGKGPVERVGLKHGAGGRAMRHLIEDVFLPLGGPVDGIGLAALDDGAAIRFGDRWVVVTTDSHVVHPIFFPGGDIGRLSISGTLGDHGMAILTKRRDLQLEGDIRSDVAPVNGLVRAALVAGGEDVVAMKDPTRGGLASSLHEMAAKAKVGVVIEEAKLPMTAEVRAAGEILGIDPLVV